MPAKLYRSKAWLLMRVAEGKTPEQIASECGTNKVTIMQWLDKFEIKRKKYK